MTDLWKIRIGTTDYDIKDTVARAGLDSKINIQQGTGNVGKALVVQSDGTVAPQTITPTGTTNWGDIGGTIANQTDLMEKFEEKQETLVSSVNIKTINNQSVLGSGNIEIEGGSTAFADITGQPTDNAALSSALAKKVTVESGKGLSSNDFNNGYKSLLDNLDTNISSKITAHNSVANAHDTLFDKKLNKEYTSAEEGYIIKIVEEGDKYIAKAVNGGETSVSFADLTGDPDDNANLKSVLDGKVDYLNYIPPIVNMVKTDVDTNGIYKTITWELPTSKIVLGNPAKWTSVLSDGDSPCYTKRVFTIYGSDKSTVLQTVTFNRTYDGNVLRSETISE